MNTNLIALGALAVLCGASSGCTAAVYPSGTVVTSYAAPVVVEEPVVVVDPAPVVVVEKTRPVFPLLVSRHRSVAPAPRHHVGPHRSAKPSRPIVASQRGGGHVSHSSGKVHGGNHSRGGGKSGRAGHK